MTGDAGNAAGRPAENNPRVRHWAEIGEVTATGGIRLLYLLYRIGGRWLFFISLWPVVVFYWAMLPRARRASLGYLRLARRMGWLRHPPTQWTVLRHQFHFADTLLDKLLSLAGHFTMADLAVTGREAFFADGSGAVIVTAHTGCLELCQALTGDPSKLYVLTHTAHARQFNRILSRINPRFAVNHLEVGDLTPAMAIELSEVVGRGGYLVIAGDRVPIGSDAVVHVGFMGREAPFPTGAAMLAMLLQCPLWSMVCTRNPDKKGPRYRLHFAKLWHPQPVARTARAGYFKTVAQRFAQTLERELADAPLDWFNLSHRA